MSLWKAVENELATIEAALAAVPPNIVEAQQRIKSLSHKVKGRKPPSTRTFTVDELKKAVEHLAFETQHVRCYMKLYKERIQAGFGGAFYQALLYALLLHLRVLINFFYGEAQRDDCHVNHFNVLNGFESAFPATIHVYEDHIREVAENLNKLLAHLSASRWENDRPFMDKYEEFMPTIDQLITRFEAALPEDMRRLYLKRYQYWENLHPATQR